MIKRNNMKSLKPNNLGKKLTSSCKQINISEYLKLARNEIKKVFLHSKMEIDGYEDIELVSAKTGISGIRYWFKCPICKRKAGIIYKHPVNQLIGCRKCLNLEYKSRRFKGMLENLAK